MATRQQVPRPQWNSQAHTVAGLSGASKSYGDGKALWKVNFSVKAGELVALLGPKGAGKTIAVKLLLSLAAPLVYLPPYHLAQMALRVIGGGSTPAPHYLEFLFGFPLLAPGITFIRYQRDEGKLYG